MRGSVRKHKGKRTECYWITLELGKDENGKRKQKLVTFYGTKPEAEKEMRRLLKQIDDGVFVDPGKMTLSQYLDKWLTDYHSAKKLAPKTYESYKMIIDLHIKPAMGDTLLKKLTPMQIQGYYTTATEKGRKDGKKTKGGTLSSSTILHHHRLLHLAMETAFKWGLIPYNIVDKVDAPKKAKNQMATLDKDQIHKVLKAIDGTYLYMPVYLAVTTGMRAGEILGLQWNNVDMDACTITVCKVLQGTVKGGLEFKVPKTEGSSRCIQISPSVIATLKRHSAKQAKDKLSFGEAYNKQWNLICCLNDGRPINPGTLSGRWRDICQKLGIKVRFHDLRHYVESQVMGSVIRISHF